MTQIKIDWVILGGVFISLYILIYSVALIEAIGKTRTIFYTKRQENLISLVVQVFVLVLLSCGFIYETEGLNEFLPLVALVIKLIMSSIVSKEAGKLNRNKVLWWILGFVEFHCALIVLSVQRGFVKQKIPALVDLNEKFKAKYDNLLELKKEKAISEKEFEKKESHLKLKYFFQLNKIESELEQHDIQLNSDKILQKLKLAYEDGLLTEEEFQRKTNELLNNSR